MIQENPRTFNIENQQCFDFVCQFNNLEKFITAFRDAYDLVIVYHGTNINVHEQNEILRNGMVVSDENFIRQKAISRFIRTEDPKELQQRILEEIDNNFNECVFVEKMIFLSHLKQELIKVSRQYLLWGPESLLILADGLKDIFDIDFRQRMIEYGDHCIISVSVPVPYISDRDIAEIYERVINDHVECCLVCRVPITSDTILGIEKQSRPANFY